MCLRCVPLVLKCKVLLVHSLKVMMLKFDMNFYINTIKLNMFLEVLKGLKSSVYVPLDFIKKNSFLIFEV